ncbi:LuxR C-terminal-related transcriptional regulator [Pleionea sediminis]|uniref:LuxR C-terminal-related transcriptional regulator n=1 Tax=Pleionea sediminis TaxID=2569479 RepID=UPI00118565C5|nr:LuxR C-terminal-related transcriptional regulator [Pleionea sediminis]
MLLTTKLRRPSLPAGFLSRAQALNALDEATACQLSLICAPAGYGKTTLMVDWIEQRRVQAAWLSLDHSDNDPIAFWFSLCSTLCKFNSRFIDKVWHHFSENDPGTQPDAHKSGIKHLVNELWSWSRSWAANETFYLVIDDFHVLHDETLMASFDDFLNHLPIGMRIILVSRKQPALSLARRRVEGKCQIITEKKLKFSRDVAEQLLTERFKLSPSADQLNQIMTRTEGWAVALQLTALAWQEKGHIGLLTNPNRYEAHGLSDYLMDEIFQCQPESVKNFLVQVARLPRFSAALCDTLLESQGSAAMLDHLIRHNLLIQALDDKNQWFRLHDLFRDWLNTLPLTEENEISLRQRAALWLETQEQTYEAFEQWVALGDWKNAARLATLHFLHWWQQGWLPRAENSLQKFPQTWLAVNPWLKYLEGFILFQRGELINASQALQEAEYCFNNHKHWAPDGKDLLADEQSVPDFVLTEFPLHLASLRAHIARLGGDIQTATRLSENLSQSEQLSVSPLFEWTLAGCCTDQFYKMNLPLAQDFGFRAIHQARRNGNVSCQMVGLIWLVSSLIQQGECNEALSWIERTLEDIGPDWKDNVWAPNLFNQRAIILREQNQLEAAAETLNKAFSTATDQLMPQCLVYFEFQRWQIALNQGKFETAKNAIEQIKYWHCRQDVPHWHYTVLEPELMTALLLAAQGQLESLLAWTQNFDPTLPQNPTWLDYARLSIWLRVQVNLGGNIKRELSRFREQAEAGNIVPWKVKAELLEFRLAQQEDSDSAKRFLHQALWLSIKHDQLRTFLDDGPGLITGLQDCLGDEGVAKEAGRILTAMGVEVPKQTEANAPLSERERQVLALLKLGKSNPELAQELGVSLSTVKAHLRNIFVKLGVKNRTQAISQAGKFGFVSP